VVHRRDFLLLRRPSSPRIVELSCERLHMAYVDVQMAATEPDERPGDFSFAEPAAIRPQRDVDEWLRDLEAELGDADVVKVAGDEWLRPDALRAAIEAMLERLVQRGVRVEALRKERTTG
jgi:hypothetical protein